MAMAAPARLEPMNASPHHPKVRVSLKLADSTFSAGGEITGKMELECKADRGLGIGVIMVELFAVEELTSRDHSATSTFLHTRRLFQGPNLPPSNAVQPHSQPGDPPLPTHYHTARRGMTTFLFRLPVPRSSPSAINFGSGLAQVRYEVRATVGVAWKGENRLVFDKKSLDIVECFEDYSRVDSEGIIVGENGKIWVQGRVIGGYLVAGQPGCIELQVKNHSSKRNTGLVVSLIRELHLPRHPQKQPLQITDTLTSVSFRGPEYIVQPGAEGVASLVFDLPSTARGVKGGIRQGDEDGLRKVEALFEVRCLVNVKMSMGIGSNDIILIIPVTVYDPSVAPSLPDHEIYASPPQPPMYSPPMSPVPLMDRPLSPYVPPMSPPYVPYIDQGQVWQTSSVSPWQQHHALYPPPASPPMSHWYYNPPHSLSAPYSLPFRSSSTGPVLSQPFHGLPPNLPPHIQQSLIPLPTDDRATVEREEGKGERASRIAYHLRMSSRNRSASPPAHRYALPAAPDLSAEAAPLHESIPIPIPGNTSQATSNLSPSSSPRTRRYHPPTLNLSVSPALSQGSVVSPRPMLSPKHSFTVDPFAQVTQVEQLERIAAQVDKENADMSVSPALTGDIRDKTLPRVPDLTGQKSAPIAVSTRVNTLFPGSAVRPEDTPPTPTLAALTSLKVPRSVSTNASEGLSGLDALEAKLLAEVGTRKMEKPERPDVRTVLPITIPRPTEADPANDSAISSLTLPGLDSDAKTLRVEQTNLDHEYEEPDGSRTSTERRIGRDHDRESKENKTGESVGTRKSRDKEKRKRSGERAGGAKDEEFHRLRKTAHGRVAAWLGSIEPEVPPQSGTPPPTSPGKAANLTDLPREDAQGRVAAWLGSLHADPSETNPQPANPSPVEDNARVPDSRDADPETVTPDQPQEPPEPNAEEISAAPNPRSSGFVPISTLRPEKSWRAIPPGDPSTPKPAGKMSIASPRLTAYTPRPADPEVRYDIRSARGGRGGKVAAVAAIWASATQQKDAEQPKKPPPPPPKRTKVPMTALPANDAVIESSLHPQKTLPAKPTARFPRPVVKPPRPPQSFQSSAPTGRDVKPMNTADLTASRARMIKSTSVPAVISSSLATPMLSSTASLARPSPPHIDKRRLNIKLAPFIPEEPQVTGKADATTAKSPAAKGDLAFGQARLRELIKRYQGQHNA